MNWNLPATAKPVEIVEFVQEHGIAVLNSYLGDKQLVSMLRREAIRAADQSKHEYKFGHAARFGTDIPISYPTIKHLVNRADLREIVKLAKKTPEGTFITHEFVHDGPWDRNGFLHFDRLHAFKLFFYLTPVDENCGPFCAIIDTHKEFRALRTKEWQRTSDYDKIRNRPPIDFPDLGYAESDGNPVLGPAGTMIVFDTDTLHKCRVVKEHRHRVVLRTHNR